MNSALFPEILWWSNPRMELETLLLAAIQSSFLLGLLHGVNPCGHSWLVLAPFVAAEKKSSRVALLTGSFLAGTALACLGLGATLGAVSQVIPPAMGTWMEGGTSLILLVIGLLLLYNPHILHHHDDADDHEHRHHHGVDNIDHGGSHHSCTLHTAQPQQNVFARLKRLTKNKKLLPQALFGIGFVNMIIPCPTAAVMYGYALNSGSTLAATLVFGSYAISTALAVSAVIFLIYKTTSMANSLGKEWIEPLIMRLAGAVIVIFSSYGLYHAARP
jgi:nickel/cobalt exporter